MTVNDKKTILFIACLLPAGMMIYRLFNQQLGAEPVDAMLTITGLWTLRFLLLTLAVTPIRKLSGYNAVPYRRMLGLYAFFYALLHLLIYLAFEQSFSPTAVVDDVLKRPFIFVGMLAFFLLIPLAVTSTKAMMKRLGKRWKTLHKAVYWLTGLALLHFFWAQKSDYTEPLFYLGIFIILLLLRRLFGKSLRQRDTA